MQSRTAIIVLAAGASGRLGQPKQMLRCGGETLVRRAVRVAVEAKLGPVFVVLAEDDTLSAVAIGALPYSVVINADPQRGMGSSIKAGMDAVDASIDSVLIMLCDQPAVCVEVLRSLASLLPQSTASVVASTYGGTAGVPAIFGKSMFGDLRSLHDHAGAKSLLESLGDRLATLDFPAGEQDIDTPDDLQKLL